MKLKATNNIKSLNYNGSVLNIGSDGSEMFTEIKTHCVLLFHIIVESLRTPYITNCSLRFNKLIP